MNTSRAIFAGGCFWDLQHHFDEVRGVISTQCGYIGGRVPNPTYMEISSGRTGHAQAVEVTFNPKLISYDHLLDIFFAAHNPTAQGNAGPQYRSAIFYLSEDQRKQAFKKIHALAAAEKFKAPIITEIASSGVFYPAEDPQQHYRQKHPSCSREKSV